VYSSFVQSPLSTSTFFQASTIRKVAKAHASVCTLFAADSSFPPGVVVARHISIEEKKEGGINNFPSSVTLIVSCRIVEGLILNVM
jgi:hypothetical protein